MKIDQARYCLTYNEKSKDDTIYLQIKNSISIARIYDAVVKQEKDQMDNLDKLFEKKDGDIVQYIVKKPIKISIDFEEYSKEIYFSYIDKQIKNNKKNKFITIFEKDIELKCDNVKNYIEFESCEFYGKINFKENCKFYKKIDFKNCNFNGEVIFKNCKFYKRVDFSNCKFNENIFFNNSTFKEFVDFHECEFQKVACFYGVTFKQPPSFSNAIFSSSLNLVNTTLDFNFEKIKKRIEKECEEYNKNNENNKKKKGKADFANNFRDSFRCCKNALIKDNNLLDASNHHKNELYCKEIELEYLYYYNNEKKDKRNIFTKEDYKFFDWSNLIKLLKNILCLVLIPIKAIRGIIQLIFLFLIFMKKTIQHTFIALKPFSFTKFKIYWQRLFKLLQYKFERQKRKKIPSFAITLDYILLQIYRITSDHHTNLAKISEFTILMIVTYGLFINFSEFIIGRYNPYQYSGEYIFLLIALFMLIYILFIPYTRKILTNTQTKIIGALFLLMALFCVAFLYCGAVSIFMQIYCLFLYFAYQLFRIKNFTCRTTISMIVCLISLIFILKRPGLINPFINIFQSDSLIETKFDDKLLMLDDITLIELSKKIKGDTRYLYQPTLPLNYVERNSIVDFIKANKKFLFNEVEENYNTCGITRDCGMIKITIQTIQVDDIFLKVIKSTSVIYSIILLLCVFSLQKTARKNSIVPS